MAEYHPDVREVRCRILTPREWVEASFPVPRKRGFLEHLSVLPEFDLVTNARFLSTEAAEPFLDLHRDAMLLIIPPPGESEPVGIEAKLPHVEHEVRCLLRGAHVRGSLQLLPAARVSSWIRSRRGFVTLRDARIESEGKDARSSGPHAAVVVNTNAIIGVSEPAGHDIVQRPPITY